MEFIMNNVSAILSVGIFTVTACGYLPYCRFAVDRNYIKVLYELFKPVKELTPSRHGHGKMPAPTLEEMFKERKMFFQSLVGADTEGKDNILVHKTLFIHVVGTKGKGSTCEFLRLGCMKLVTAAMLKEEQEHPQQVEQEHISGNSNNSHRTTRATRVGVFTSPHMHTARERVKIGATLISKEDVIRLGNTAINMFRHTAWAVFFDYLLLIGLKYFQEQKVDICILEAGVGGRYDSTNFIETGRQIIAAPVAPVTPVSVSVVGGITVTAAGTSASAVSTNITSIDASHGDCESVDHPQLRLWVVIANISLDHQSMLGSTVEAIAWQKVGAIKPYSHVFTCVTTQLPSVMEIIRDTCRTQRAVLHEVSIPAAVVGNTVRENQQLADAVLDHMCSSGMCSRVGQTYSGTGEHTAATQDNGFYWPCRMEKFHVPLTNLTSTAATIADATKSATATAIPSDEPTGEQQHQQQKQRDSKLLVILDGCHNGYSVNRFMETIHNTGSSLLCTCNSTGQTHPDTTAVSEKPLIYTLFGVGVEKRENITGMLQSVGQYSDKIVLVRSKHFRSMGLSKLRGQVPRELASKVMNLSPFLGPEVANVNESIVELFKFIAQRGDSQRSIVTICGSLFVAAEARECLFDRYPDLFAANDWVREKEFLGDL